MSMKHAGCGEWVSCGYRLPEIGERVLVVSYTGVNRDKPFVRIGIFEDYHTGEVLCFSEDGYVMPTQPVYWRHIPRPPTSEQAKEAM